MASKSVVAEHEFSTPQPLPVPSWSPNGKQILFVESTGTAYQLKVWDVDSGEIVVPKALLSKNIHSQQWNAEGSRILHFVHPLEDARSWRDAQRALYWVDPAGIAEPELYVPAIGQSYHKALAADGRLAVLFPTSPRGKNVLTVRTDGASQDIPLDPTSEIGQISWSGSRSLLMSVRRAGEDFYGIQEVDLADGSVRRLLDERWDLSAAGYLWDGTALRHVVNVDGLRRTRICKLPVSEGCYWVGPEHASSSILAQFANGDSAFVLVAGPNEPPSLHVADLRTGRSIAVVNVGETLRLPIPGGVPLNISSDDGLRIPAYYWKARPFPGRRPAALIHVPGGPGLQGVPLWEPYISYLTGQGVDVVYMNYRGQTGYGASYERAAGEARARAEEVLAVRRYLIREMGFEEDRVILYGHSYGAPLVIHAATLERLSSPLLLASALPLGEDRIDAYDRCVVAFHGDSDIIVSAATARATYVRYFGQRSIEEPCGHFQEIPSEGHVFEAASSYAQVFAAAIRMIE